MNSFLRRHWRLIAILLSSSFWLVAFPIWCEWITEDPLNMPISFASAEKVQAEVRIRAPETYWLQFRFERHGVFFDDLKNSIGAMGACKIGEACSKGVPVAVRWSITSKGSGKPLFGGDVEIQDSSGWSQDYVDRFIAEVHVPPGSYLIRTELLRPVPALAKLRATIVMELPPASRWQSWQLVFTWWGKIIQYLLVLPLAIIAAIVLLWRAGGALWSSKCPPASP